MASAIPSLLFCLLLLAPHLGSSYHTSYAHGGRHFVLRSSDDSRRIPSTCSPIPSGDGGGLARPLPVMHRLSPCAPHGDSRNPSMPSVGDAFYRDGLRLRALFGELDDSKSGLTVPTTGTPLVALPGASEYHVVVGYGTPAQKFTVGFDTATVGATLLQCKPCAAGAPCDRAFDPSLSSSISQIPCGSPNCPLRACSGPGCTFTLTKKGAVLLNATVVTDTLTLTQSIAVENFRFVCLEMGLATTSSDGSSGVLDLSRERHSLASRVVLSPDTVAFSYCLPSDTASQGFLSFGAARPERSGRSVSYATLRSNAAHPNLYFVKLAGLSVGPLDVPIPPSTATNPAGDGDSLVELHTTFTYLKPDMYAVLRSEFRGLMRQYRVAPPLGELDTCYDFTGLNIIEVPIITLKFDGGASLELLIEQMLYFKDPKNVFSVACLAFAAAPADAPAVAVIGSMAQAATEVVYDVLGGKVGFVTNRC